MSKKKKYTGWYSTPEEYRKRLADVSSLFITRRHNFSYNTSPDYKNQIQVKAPCIYTEFFDLIDDVRAKGYEVKIDPSFMAVSISFFKKQEANDNG